MDAYRSPQPVRRRRLWTLAVATAVAMLALLALPVAPASAAANDPVGNLESVSYHPWTGWTTGGLGVSGWALDPNTTSPIAIHVYVDGSLFSVEMANSGREDVGAAFPGMGDHHGLNVAIPAPALPDGPHTVCVYAINATGSPGANTTLGCRTVSVLHRPVGGFDAVAFDAPGIMHVRGWVLDRDTNALAQVHVYVDGAYRGVFGPTVARPDVAAAYPDQGAGPFGYEVTLAAPVASGARQVCVYAINVPGTPGTNVTLGCRSLAIDHDPIGALDSVAQPSPGLITWAGWALDRDTAASINTRLSIDGTSLAPTLANGFRSDIGVAFPGYGNGHGIEAGTPSTSAMFPEGDHTFCMTGINATSTPGADRVVGCRAFFVQHSPIGNLESVHQGSLTFNVTGWALDHDIWGSTVVHIYVDGVFRLSWLATTQRQDVSALFPTWSDARGFSGMSLAGGPGTWHQVCAYAINAPGTPGNNSVLGCLNAPS